MIEILVVAAIVFLTPYFVTHFFHALFDGPKQIEKKKPNYDWIYDFEIEVWGWSHIPREYLSSRKIAQIERKELYDRQIAHNLERARRESELARERVIQNQRSYEAHKDEYNREYEKYRKETYRSKELVPYYPKVDTVKYPEKLPVRAYSYSTGKSYSVSPPTQEMEMVQQGMISPRQITEYLNDS